VIKYGVANVCSPDAALGKGRVCYREEKPIEDVKKGRNNEAIVDLCDM